MQWLHKDLPVAVLSYELYRSRTVRVGDKTLLWIKPHPINNTEQAEQRLGER